jgi:hypothetical protein
LQLCNPSFNSLAPALETSNRGGCKKKCTKKVGKNLPFVGFLSSGL